MPDLIPIRRTRTEFGPDPNEGSLSPISFSRPLTVGTLNHIGIVLMGT
jgi:hypothetical protein